MKGDGPEIDIIDQKYEMGNSQVRSETKMRGIMLLSVPNKQTDFAGSSDKMPACVQNSFSSNLPWLP